MSLLAGLVSQEGVNEERDVLGGFGVWETDIYDCVITLAYAQKSSGGATGITFHVKSDKGSDLRFTQYVTGGDAKGNKNYYEKDGQKHYLPGFNIVNAICQLTVDKELGNMETEMKKVKLWDSDAKAEVPKDVPVLVELLNQHITLGVEKVIVDKTVKNSSTNEYVPTGETREENEINKIYHTDTHMTVQEIKGKMTSPEFYQAWLEKNKGKTRNKAKFAGKGQTGTNGAPAAGSAPVPAKKSLFGSKAAE